MEIVERNPERNPASNPASTSRSIAGILVLSAVATAFLFWLVYLHKAPAGFAAPSNGLAAAIATFNGLSAVALATGFVFIRRRNISAHKTSMMTAFVFSSLFLVCYVINHALHGEIRFAGHGSARTVYLSILVSHIFLSVVALPMILITFFYSLTGRFRQHRAIARFTFPIWLYVGVTGVIVYLMLYRIFPMSP